MIVADVVGKGVAAALLMAKLSAEARFCLASGGNAAQAINMLNERLCRLHLDRFVTAVMVLLDPRTHEVSIANAGHMAPILRTKDGKMLEPGSAEAGLPLGIDGSAGLRGGAKSSLAPGESLTMYTDGLNEAVSEAGAYFTIDRIRKRIQATNGLPSVRRRRCDPGRLQFHRAGDAERRHVPGHARPIGVTSSGGLPVRSLSRATSRVSPRAGRTQVGSGRRVSHSRSARCAGSRRVRVGCGRARAAVTPCRWMTSQTLRNCTGIAVVLQQDGTIVSRLGLAGTGLGD